MKTYILIYFAIISVIAIIITIYDKSCAKKNSWRVKERSLLTISALGGSAAMLFTMMSIRHKTKHIKFMLGIPVIILLQVVLAVALLYWGVRI